MTGRYELRKGGLPGHEVWYFVLKSPQGQTLATSELYASRPAALEEIHAVRRCAATLTVNDLTQYSDWPS